MTQLSTPEARFFEWNDLPLLARPDSAGEVVLNCAFDPPREIVSPGLLQRARKISLREFERLRAIHRAAWREHFSNSDRDADRQR